MKRPVSKLDEALVRRTHPIADRVPGWFFRVEERSPGQWYAEGIDLWGRKVAITADDDERALSTCIADVQEIKRRLPPG
ncbi:MAG TPA: hypothetical protein VFY71_05490 [Planctomycetota bacterium]|nr:hypothetical protein [Planctomycetota bacterium]